MSARVGVRTGFGYDSHRLSAGRRLRLGGVVIEEAERGLAGHSDGDVLTHAVMDALLGAAALGDIGQHFPDTDPDYRDAESLGLLTEVCALLADQGWTVAHLDATVICEQPRLAPHRDAMRELLSNAVGLDATCVSVKFTTDEGMGFVGRGEGMAAHAVATVERAP